MDFEDSLNAIAKTITEKKAYVTTEEATKFSFIIPFLKILGYDVTNPKIVVPEFTADIGAKKGEKVDFAILKDGKPFILIEAKNHTENLNDHTNQLIRYFQTDQSIKFGILTNGIEYRFFTDIDCENIMDKKPFLVINLEKLKPRDTKDLEKFVCSKLDLEKIKSSAKEKRYCHDIQEIFKKQIENPDNEFIAFFAKQLTDKRMRNSVVSEFKTYIKEAFKQLVEDLANDRIAQAYKDSIQKAKDEEDKTNEELPDKEDIITTEEELQGFYVVKSILAESNANLDEISYKDTRHYFGIFYQKSTNWICRLYFNRKQKRIEFPDGTKYNVDKVESIYKFKDFIIKAYENRK